MIPELGQFALILALFVTLVQGVVPLAGAARNNARLMGLAVPAARLQFALVALAFGCLAWSSYAACKTGACTSASACLVCQDTCPAASATVCSQGQLQTCTADTHGCLAWSAP